MTIIQVVHATGFSADDVSRAARRLQADHLIDGNTLADGSFQNFHTVTGRGLRMADAWPTPENVADRMIAVLEEIAANTSDEDTRSRVKKILDALKGPGKAIIIASIGKIITEGMTGL